VTHAGVAVGDVRSACLSPTLGRVIALAVLDAKLIATGLSVGVATDHGVVAATVTEFPVYDPEKLRPRA
jgi:glycine cleavage system aminomethyltransferase T